MGMSGKFRGHALRTIGAASLTHIGVEVEVAMETLGDEPIEMSHYYRQTIARKQTSQVIT